MLLKFLSVYFYGSSRFFFINDIFLYKLKAKGHCGNTWHDSILTRSNIYHQNQKSNTVILPETCMPRKSSRKRMRGKEQKLASVETSEFQEKS